jgi:hypothetical protein
MFLICAFLTFLCMLPIMLHFISPLLALCVHYTTKFAVLCALSSQPLNNNDEDCSQGITKCMLVSWKGASFEQCDTLPIDVTDDVCELDTGSSWAELVTEYCSRAGFARSAMLKNSCLVLYAEYTCSNCATFVKCFKRCNINDDMFIDDMHKESVYIMSLKKRITCAEMMTNNGSVTCTQTLRRFMGPRHDFHNQSTTVADFARYVVCTQENENDDVLDMLITPLTLKVSINNKTPQEYNENDKLELIVKDV